MTYCCFIYRKIHHLRLRISYSAYAGYREIFPSANQPFHVRLDSLSSPGRFSSKRIHFLQFLRKIANFHGYWKSKPERDVNKSGNT